MSDDTHWSPSELALLLMHFCNAKCNVYGAKENVDGNADALDHAHADVNVDAVQDGSIYAGTFADMHADRNTHAAQNTYADACKITSKSTCS
jgi:hypothetical protein